MASERRIDPDDGVAYAWEDMLAFYRPKYPKKDIEAYWETHCVPAKPGRKGSRAKPPKAKTTSKAATGEASSKVSQEGSPAVGEALVQTMAQRDLDWRIGPVVYQVFVDRFAPPASVDAKKELYPSPCTVQMWSELPRGGVHNPQTNYYTHELAFWGGDLPSLLSKADYIKDLGIDVLYLQPVAEAFSNHKYDTTDYLKLDAQYGTLDDFKKLADRVHDMGMRLVLDGVFNHVGNRSPHFQEALQDRDSSKRDWFFFGDEHPHGYKVWGCAPSLVELRLESASIQEYLWKAKDSVVATWLARGADGWRLDVASELGFDILTSLTRSAHAHKHDSLIVGEVWAYPPRWTSALDGVLSLHLGVLIYGLAEGTCPGPSAAQSITQMIHDSSMEEVLRSWIVLSNHDMPRLATRLLDLRLRKFAQVLQFTWPGAPLIYYGDELGLPGGDDPLNRAAMPWDDVKGENEMLQHTRKLVALRKSTRALRIGDFTALASQRLMAFVRTTDRVMDVVVVLANPTDERVKEMVVVPCPAILGHTLFRCCLSGEEVRALGSTVTVEVPPKSVRLFTMVDESGSPSGDQYKRMYGHSATFVGIKP